MTSPRHIEVGVDVLTVHGTDALSALRQMPDESVQCVVTSPPYWSLRDYGIPPIVWDGDPECDHLMQDEAPRAGEAYGGKTKWQHVAADAQAAGIPVREQAPDAWEDLTVYRDSPIRDGGEGVGFNDAATTKGQRWKTSAVCTRCGAWRGCLGLEPTPELYVQHIVHIFREVKRVLRKDGTLWLNLGDSYASGKGSCFNPGGGATSLEGHAKLKEAGAYKLNRGNKSDLDKSGLKPKDLIGIPWRCAFALQADGWWLRSDIVWSKSNPMPESITDRPTKSHEYIFLLTKSKTYYYDAEAIKEPAVADHGSGNGYKRDARLTYDGPGSDKPYVSARDNFRRENSKRGQPQFGQTVGTHRPDRKDTVPSDMRNKRSVWEIPTAPFPEAHFATFPKDLVIPCVLAGSKAGDIVLDPFGGSGTVGKVAIELGRKTILIEPNPEYVKMIEKRTTTTMGLPL